MKKTKFKPLLLVAVVIICAVLLLVFVGNNKPVKKHERKDDVKFVLLDKNADGEYETYTNMDSILHFVFSIKDNPIYENYYEVYFTNYCAPKGTYSDSRWSGNETIDYYDKVFPPGKIKVFDDSMFDSSPYNMKLSLRGWKRWYWNLLNLDNGVSITESNVISAVNLFKGISSSQNGYYYLKSFESNREAMSDIFTEPKTLYSNITGGKGIFIGYSYSHLHLEFLSHLLGGLVISNEYIPDDGSFGYQEQFKNISSLL